MFICRSDDSGGDGGVLGSRRLNGDGDGDGNALQLVLAIRNVDQRNLMIGRENANGVLRLAFRS